MGIIFKLIEACRINNLFGIVIFTAGLSCIFQFPAFAQVNLTFGTYAADKPTATARKFIPFVNYLANEMSLVLDEPVTIKIKIASQYSLAISDLTDGHVDFARFGPASYVTAKKQNPDIRIIAVETKKGKKTFKGIIAVNSDSSIKNLADLKGYSFAFGDKLSTIGRYLAQAQLLDAGISGKNLKNFAYLGRHDKVGAAVGNKYFDAGALKESTYKKMQAGNTPIKAIFSFDNVTKPWIARAGLPLHIYAALNTVMLKVTDPDVLKNFSKSGFLSGSDSDYDIIRSAITRSEQFD